MIKTILTAVLLTTSTSWASEQKFDFNFKRAPIEEVAQFVSKKLHKIIILDPSVRGQITVMNPEPVDADEMYAQFSTGLAQNNLAISVQDDHYVINSARWTERSYLKVIKGDLPPMKPERLVTYIYQFKNAEALEINKNIRSLSSTDGEIYADQRTNQLVITDWISNIYRVKKLLDELDQKVEKTQ